MQIFMQIATVVLAIGAAWWLIAKMRKREWEWESESKSPGDPFARVPASRRPNPKGRAGAVALEEPDDEEPADAYPPRTI